MVREVVAKRPPAPRRHALRRYRGLFKLNGFLAKSTMAARFDALPAPSAEHPGGRVLCEQPRQVGGEAFVAAA